MNSILEAFGHARTPMNTNSSRFIKLLSLQYSEKRRTLLRGLFLVHLTIRFILSCAIVLIIFGCDVSNVLVSRVKVQFGCFELVYQQRAPSVHLLISIPSYFSIVSLNRNL